MDRKELADMLEAQAEVIAQAGHAGWGNTMLTAAAALRESEEWRRDAESGGDWPYTFLNTGGKEYVPKDHANRRVAALQSRIDALMLEYCPDEMTDEQRAEWARHQVPAIDAARKEGV